MRRFCGLCARLALLTVEVRKRSNRVDLFGFARFGFVGFGSMGTIFLAGALLAPSAWGQVLHPTPGAPFTERQAAHLLRRAGFGGSPAEIKALAERGREGAVDSLLFYEEIPGESRNPFPEEEVVELERRLSMASEAEEREAVEKLIRRVDRRHMQLLRDWWVERMVTTRRPLEEKMTLFWHGHFTSGYREVQSSRLLFEQNDFLRHHGLSHFKTLLHGISRDGAMLRYLDNVSNVKSSPNENYARELMELFTLGEGNYSEKDIREAARAFTGWSTDLEGFRVDARQHDRSTKTIFGARGRFDGDHVITLLLRHPQASRYLARRLWEFFAYPEPESEIVEALARLLRESHFSVRVAMRAILASDAFYSDRAYLAKIKSPAEVVVGAVRALEIDNYRPEALYRGCRDMGQDLFQPPNVKGWDGEQTWITATTLLARYNFGERVLGLEQGATTNGREIIVRRYGGPGQPATATVDRPFDPMPAVVAYGLRSPASIVRHFVTRLLHRDVSPDRFQVLLEALDPPGREPFALARSDARVRIRNLVFLILSMPEYQLN